MEKGQAEYEADVARRPRYHDGTPRKSWPELGEVEKWSWGRTDDRLAQETRAVAKKIAHHGPANLIETMKQRAKTQLPEALADSLCREYGWRPAS
jgi:hypothetical protein